MGGSPGYSHPLLEELSSVATTLSFLGSGDYGSRLFQDINCLSELRPAMFTYSIPSFIHLLHSLGLLGVTQAEISQRCPLQTVFQPSDLGHLLTWIVLNKFLSFRGSETNSSADFTG